MFFGKEKVVSYKYNGERWISEDNKFVDENLGYVNGINEIVKKVSAVGEKLVVDKQDVSKGRGFEKDKKMAARIFEILKK